MSDNRTVKGILTDVLISAMYLENMLDVMGSATMLNDDAREGFFGAGEYCRMAVVEKLKLIDLPDEIGNLKTDCFAGSNPVSIVTKKGEGYEKR